MQFALFYSRIHRTWASPQKSPTGMAGKTTQAVNNTDGKCHSSISQEIDNENIFACVDLQREVTHRGYCSSSSYPLIIENAPFISETPEKSYREKKQAKAKRAVLVNWKQISFKFPGGPSCPALHTVM